MIVPLEHLQEMLKFVLHVVSCMFFELLQEICEKIGGCHPGVLMPSFKSGREILRALAILATTCSEAAPIRSTTRSTYQPVMASILWPRRSRTRKPFARSLQCF